MSSQSSSSWARAGGLPGAVGEVKVIKGMPRMEEALLLLNKLHSLCKPIQKKYGWYLPTLTEFFPSNPNLLGMNQNSGETIFIRLRPADDRSAFLPLEESLVGTLLHEFTHNVHGPHHKQFYEFLDKLQNEYDLLQQGGYTGEGFFSQGKRAGSTRDLPPHLARQKALQRAQQRQQINSIMGPAGGNRLGLSKATMGKTPRQMAAESAERRAQDNKACGHGSSVSSASVEQEMDKAKLEAVTLDDACSSSEAAANTSAHPSTGQQVPAEVTAESEDSDIEVISPAGPTVLANPADVERPPKASSSQSVEQRKRSLDQAGITPKRSTKFPRAIADSWTCSACTFDNGNLLALACEVCATERRTVKPQRHVPISSYEAANIASNMYGASLRQSVPTCWTCHLCGAETEHQWWTCRLCGHLKRSSANV